MYTSDYGKMKGKPTWCTGDDYTREEVEDLLQVGLDRFELQQFEEREFSGDLVHAGRDPHPANGQARFCFQGPEPFTMLSLKGEPLEFRLFAGYIKHYRDRRPTQWKVLDSDESEIAGGELPSQF